MLDWVADLRYCRQTGRAGAWLTVLLKIVYVLMSRMLGLVVLLRRGDRAQDAELLVPRHENAVLRGQAGRVRSEPGSGSVAQLEDVRGDVDVILQDSRQPGQGGELRLADGDSGHSLILARAS